MYWFDHFYVSLGFLFCQKRVVLTIFLKTLQLSQSHLPWFSFPLPWGLHGGQAWHSSPGARTGRYAFASFLADLLL